MNKEDDQNIIALLKIALEFYADVDVYVVKPKTNSKAISMVGIDEGSQARFALKKLDEFEKSVDKIYEDYDNIMTNAIKSEESQENVFKIMEDLKNIKDGD